MVILVKTLVRCVLRDECAFGWVWLRTDFVLNPTLVTDVTEYIVQFCPSSSSTSFYLLVGIYFVFKRQSHVTSAGLKIVAEDDFEL